MENTREARMLEGAVPSGGGVGGTSEGEKTIAEMTLEIIRPERDRLAGSIGRIAEMLGLVRCGGLNPNGTPIEVGPSTLAELCEEAVLQLRESRDDWKDSVLDADRNAARAVAARHVAEDQLEQAKKTNALLEREVMGAFEIAKGYSDAQAETIKAITEVAMRQGVTLFGRGVAAGIDSATSGKPVPEVDTQAVAA